MQALIVVGQPDRATRRKHRRQQHVIEAELGDPLKLARPLVEWTREQRMQVIKRGQNASCNWLPSDIA
jgi:hypothetical protein